MGLFTTLAAFAGGYLAGAKMGDRPLETVKESIGQARDRASTLMSEARQTAKGEPVQVDVRAVREVMTAPVESVGLDAPIRDAAKAMQHKDIGDVLVVGEAGEDRDPATTTAQDVMTPIGATVRPDTTVSEALDLMRRHDVRRLPVIEAGVAVGIVTLGDLSRSGGAGAALADISTAPANT
jgi:CBS domain-containing protein